MNLQSADKGGGRFGCSKKVKRGSTRGVRARYVASKVELEVLLLIALLSFVYCIHKLDTHLKSVDDVPPMNVFRRLLFSSPLGSFKLTRFPFSSIYLSNVPPPEGRFSHLPRSNFQKTKL